MLAVGSLVVGVAASLAAPAAHAEGLAQSGPPSTRESGRPVLDRVQDVLGTAVGGATGGATSSGTGTAASGLTGGGL
ncbi:hypothetical protein GCM10009665_30110 [Kitasatospora nipponensis]|uniref:Small secreted domain DUF320 n=2 Tax=Kitasatospora nipponensis TaxID=258049 RepID=A0ABN1W6I0_9ACTN